MATKIKLMRLGKMRAPYYRIVVADARTKRDGRVIETIGKYHPKEDPSFIEVDSARVQYWLSVGAQPTEPVAAILRVTGDWQQFKGLPAPEPMQQPKPKADKRVAFEAAAKESHGEPTTAATSPRKKAAKAAAPAEAAAAADVVPDAATPDAGEDTEPTATATEVTGAASEAGTPPSSDAGDLAADADAGEPAAAGDGEQSGT